jgi:hypothetical protein
MSDDKKPIPGSDEHWEWVRRRAEARGKQLANAGAADFDETGILSGGEDSLISTDAEAFPCEIEEYTPEERKPRLVPKKK